MNKKNITALDIQKDIIGHIEAIASSVKEQKKSIAAVKVPQESLKITEDFLTLNRTQTILFSIIFILSFNNSYVDIKEIAEYIGCNTLSVARYLKEIEYISRKKLIRFESRISGYRMQKDPNLNDISFNVTINILNAVLENNMSLIRPSKKVDLVTLLENIYQLVESRDEEEISFSDVTDETDILLHENSKMPFVRRIKSFNLGDEEQILLLYVCRESVNGNLEVDLSRVCEKIYDNPSARFRVRRRIIKKTSRLTELDLVALEDGVFRSDRMIKLTERAFDLLFEEDKSVLLNENKKDKRVISHTSIKKADLFYDEELKLQLDELRKMLSKNKYRAIKNRLRKSGLPTGMNILFYGSPGTGKTATAYQLAFLSKRDIMMVDISDTKSMWFGESEKVIKKVFEEYRQLVAKEKVTPILLFNECDAVFGKRKNVAYSSVGQTENAIQNIILQEMENLEGILIGTTNLTINLDPAFERRFLYKVDFPNPSFEIRSKIWKSKIKNISYTEAKQLAEKYDFAGGNIENITRKIKMNEVLSGKPVDINQIMTYCENELLSGKNLQRIGFSYPQNE